LLAEEGVVRLSQEELGVYNSSPLDTLLWRCVINTMGKSLAFVLLYGLFVLCGCSLAVRKPQLLHPGPAGFQRHNATQFDPFPQNDVAPEIVGGRPRDFQKPPDEVIRSRQYQPPGLWRSGPLY